MPAIIFVKKYDPRKIRKLHWGDIRKVLNQLKSWHSTAAYRGSSNGNSLIDITVSILIIYTRELYTRLVLKVGAWGHCRMI